MCSACEGPDERQEFRHTKAGPEIPRHRKKATKGSNKVCKAGKNKGKPHDFRDKQVYNAFVRDGKEFLWGWYLCRFCGKHGKLWQNYKIVWSKEDNFRKPEYVLTEVDQPWQVC